MSVAVDGRIRKAKLPHIRRGPGLPQLLAAFPDPPNNLLLATSAASSPQLSPVSPLRSPLPPIGNPPSGPLPDIPKATRASLPRSKNRKQMTAVTVDDARSSSRTPSPDLKAILSNSVRRVGSRVRLNGRSSRSESVGDDHDSGDESGGSESSIDIHTPLPCVFLLFCL